MRKLFSVFALNVLLLANTTAQKPTINPTLVYPKVTGQTTVSSATITGTSTAEECVRFIDNKLKTSIGKKLNETYTITSVFFSGGKYVYHSSWGGASSGYSISQNNFSNINWGCYKSLVIKDFNANLIKATLYFDASCPVSSQFKLIDSETGVPFISNKEWLYDSLGFYFSKSEQAALADLDKAAKRLSQIVKEKGNIFKAESFKPKVIEGKPGFKETVEYIQDNYTREISCYGYTKSQHGTTYSGERKQHSITVALLAGSDSLCISWYDNLRIPGDIGIAEKTYYRTYSLTFSIRDIESIESSVWLSLTGMVTKDNAVEADFPSGIRFNAVNGKPRIRFFSWVEGVTKVEYVSAMDIPFGRYSYRDNTEAVLSDIRNTRLFKALNHLRNLCGAPEPLKFD